ncbi:TonB-dependent receptor [Paraglaciecola sp. L3A3]|uniref:TonB-dependent receptor n=1 Tax=Paraglaciecola sp. L3A3 TaxID=2686358 RepID=UPI00131B1109|nr:TonB-dependent receptor [Paraglaciecola sp. L3A3]
MYNISRIAALLSALLPTSVLAQSIEGTVKNSDGNVVAGALIRIEGSTNSIVTDQAGRFVINDLSVGNNEFHIAVPGYAHLHQDIVLAKDEVKSLALTLSRSPIEVIDIVSTPIHMSVMESASPVNVISGETLRRQQAATLGDTLEKLPGVQTNFHGNVASTPIIRGLSGPRVLIAQNGLDVSDVSRVGPDHSVASEASTSQQIEVLRGPATLFYGSGAIGGVVNVVDGRVPTDSSTRGEWLLENASVNDQKLASFNATTGTDSFGFYADGYWRKSNDYAVPVEAEADHDDHDDHDHDEHQESHDYTVANSAEESSGFTLGGSYLFNKGYVGVAIEQFNREYGVPGHSHGGEDENVYADLEQTRIQLLGEFNLDGDWLKKINLRTGITDYEHAEIETGEIGTLFENQTEELKLDIIHSTFADWNGGLSFQYKNSEVAAQGEEAFTPPSKAQTIALGLMEEKHIGDVLLQLGARIERVTLEADNVLLPQLEAHDHAEEVEEDEHDHDHEEESNITRVFAVDHEFTPVSLSAGLVWEFTEGYNLGLSVSRSQRAPSASELLSFGPHIGTGSYEVGALFGMHQEDGETHIELTEQTIDLETANNIDLTLRKSQGDLAFVFNVFYNQVDNYYYQTDTGLFAESGHDHDHSAEDEHDHGVEDETESDEHSDELPVYIFQTDDVILHGFEAQIAWQATSEFKATIFSDFVRARLKNGGNLPRTSPIRFGTQFTYQNEKLSAHLDITRYQEQDKVTSTETITDGYTMVDASVSYDVPLFNQDIAVYFKGNNLTDTEARVHTSFIKDVAPRPGRNISVGVRGYF